MTAKILLIFILSTIVAAVTGSEVTNYLSNDEIIGGIIMPDEVIAHVGSDVAIKLTNPFAPPQVCEYRNPKSNQNSNIGSDYRVLNWEQTSCGIIIKNITKEDEGFWRLTSKRDNEYVRGIAAVVVLDSPPPETSTMDVMDEKRYCVVRRPDAEAFPKVNDCKVPPHEPGKWIINVGSDGKYMEKQLEIFVEPKVAKLKTSIERDSKKVSIACNVVGTHQTVEVCRFVRAVDGTALQVYDGLGGERYRYFGKGFENGECGLTIENPSPLDKSLWKCYVHTSEMVEKEKTSFDYGSIIDLSSPALPLTIDHTLKRQALLTSSPSTLYCPANLPISHCMFRKPNGDILSVSEKEMAPKAEEDTKQFWYSGVGFGLGDCQITIGMAKSSDAGEWRCSVGEMGKTGYESSHTFNVEVRKTDPMIVAATERVDINLGEPFMIDCRSLVPHTPLESCRFVPPVGSGFSINEQISEGNSLGNYHFHPNKNMSSGDCSLIVKRARKEHTGTWYCFGKSAVWDKEGSDRVQVVVRDGISIATSSWLGVILAAIFIVMMSTIAVGVIVKRRKNRARQARDNIALEETRRTSNQSTSSGEASGTATTA